MTGRAPLARAWALLGALGVICGVACDATTSRPRPDASAALDASRLDARAASDGGDPPGPDPSCVVPDVAGDLALEPAMPAPLEPLVVRASDGTALTNVELVACTPSGPRMGTFVDVTGAFTWRFSLEGLPVGETQLVFRSDPAAVARATLRVTVSPGAADAGASLDAGGRDAAASRACGPLAGSLVEGTFERGLSGMAPPGWQVRDPAFAAGCPSGVLSVVAGDPACGGDALAIDAMGSWDCYAIQAFTDYSTITAGRTYRVHARVRSERQDNPAAWFVLGVQWLDASDAVFGDEKNPRPLDVNYEWTAIEWDLVAPPAARRAVVWLSAHYPGRVTYDDVSIALLP